MHLLQSTHINQLNYSTPQNRCLPAARKSSDHFIHEPAQVVDSASANGVLADHQAGAEGVQNLVEVASDQPTRWVEGPCPHICRLTTHSIRDKLQLKVCNTTENVPGA